MNLEDQLRHALERKLPPPEFTSRVLAAAARKRPWLGWRRAAAWALAACLLLAVALGYQRQRRGERARRQVLLALTTAASELQAAQVKVGQISRPIKIPLTRMENR